MIILEHEHVSIVICSPRASLDATTHARPLRSLKCDGDMPRRDTMANEIGID